jgi:hypothetical protein
MKNLDKVTETFFILKTLGMHFVVGESGLSFPTTIALESAFKTCIKLIEAISLLVSFSSEIK